MESHRPFSASKKHGGGMYGGRSSYINPNSDEDNVHDSLSDEGLSVSQPFIVC